MKTPITIAIAALAALTIIGMTRTPGFSGQVDPGQSQSWTSQFAEGWVEVKIDGAGFGDLDLFIYDQDGELVESDEGFGSDCAARFWNREDRPLTIQLFNAHTRFPSTFAGSLR